jgi:hypothetical protein
MTDQMQPDPQQPFAPSRRDRLRPLELLIFAGILAVFTGLVVELVTRKLILVLIFAVSVFIVSLVALALLGLGAKPNAEDLEARKSLSAFDEMGAGFADAQRSEAVERSGEGSAAESGTNAGTDENSTDQSSTDEKSTDG